MSSCCEPRHPAPLPKSEIREAPCVYAFPKRPKLRSLPKDQDYKGVLEESAPAATYSCVETFGDFITADPKVLWEECESRNNHRYAVIVQDLSTQRLQAYACKNKDFTGNDEESSKVSLAETQSECHLNLQLTGFWQSLRRPPVESMYINASSFRDKWYCRAGSTQGEKVHPRYFCSPAWMKIGGLIPWNLASSAKRSKPCMGLENSS